MKPMRKQCHLHRSNPRTISSNRDTLSFSVSPAILQALIPLVTPLKPDHEFFLRCAVLSPNLANLSQLVRSNDMKQATQIPFYGSQSNLYYYSTRIFCNKTNVLKELYYNSNLQIQGTPLEFSNLPHNEDKVLI